MEVDTVLWALSAFIIGFIVFGCFMTAPVVGPQNFGGSTRNRLPDQH